LAKMIWEEAYGEPEPMELNSILNITIKEFRDSIKVWADKINY
jgi:hypothetical protein